MYQPWWPSGLRQHAISQLIVVTERPGLNPAWGMDEFIWLQIMAGTEPLNEDRSPSHREARTVKLEMKEKMAQKKNV